MTEVDWEKLDELNGKRTPGPLKSDDQAGTPGHCFMAQIWRPDGKSLAQIESTYDPTEASATAAFFVALANAFPAIKAERDAQADTIRALREENDGLREGARFAIGQCETVLFNLKQGFWDSTPERRDSLKRLMEDVIAAFNTRKRATLKDTNAGGTTL